MFESKDIFMDISVNDIFKYISEYDIFKKYCTNFDELNRSFLSDLYDDKNPSCRIYTDKNNHLVYNDRGELDHYFRCFDYIMYKYKCNFKEALRMVANDFGLLKFNIKSKPKFLLGEEKSISETKQIERSTITIEPRRWNLYDYKYWNPYGITFEILNEEEVIPCKHVYLHKNGKTIIFTSTYNNPIYAYKEYDWETNEFLGYKIYTPLNPDKNFRWLCCSDVSRSIVNFNKLPKKGNTLILTKSRKDVICCKLAGYNAISLQAESNKLDDKVVKILKSRFKNIIIFYDNDKPGLRAAEKITSKYGFKSIIIPNEYNCKDKSELIAKIGLNEAKMILKKLINEAK